MADKLNLLDNLIANDSIIVGYEAKDYKDAIHKSCEPLVNKGIINFNYYDSILKSTGSSWTILYFSWWHCYATCICNWK